MIFDPLSGVLELLLGQKNRLGLVVITVRKIMIRPVLDRLVPVLASALWITAHIFVQPQRPPERRWKSSQLLQQLLPLIQQRFIRRFTIHTEAVYHASALSQQKKSRNRKKFTRSIYFYGLNYYQKGVG